MKNCKITKKEQSSLSKMPAFSLLSSEVKWSVQSGIGKAWDFLGTQNKTLPPFKHYS